MVKKLHQTDREAIAEAIERAERTTRAELACVVAPASDAYQQYVLLYGFIAGSVLSLLLWATHTLTVYPLLLLAQLAAMTVIAMTPPLRQLCMRLVPKRVRYRRAAHRAFEEYLAMSRHVGAATPILLLYVSIAERYAHILPSRQVREKIPDDAWKDIVNTLTTTARASGIRSACTQAIHQASTILARHFPEH